MSRQAPQICTTDADVRRLVTLISQLPAHGRVVLTLRDGKMYDGVVKVRASTQVLRNPQGEEGINAAITLENPEAPHGAWNLWLDQVKHVEHLDSGLGGEN